MSQWSESGAGLRRRWLQLDEDTGEATWMLSRQQEEKEYMDKTCDSVFCKGPTKSDYLGSGLRLSGHGHGNRA
ncbi:hypothetical protein HMPREF0647_10630 [Prevotella bivia DNF00320]|uniref:Uncharacterized protein n=1 Tax=Prevotella bivia DNF00320 TaxID=1401068 RepID=A0A096A8V4_9BACT|nr:hypothetical protein [Prevotella bivia]KGF42996.1 hypothetical protein HMPREF0647_10630 [Prevotella bivia DNF00320]WIL18598.1 hypothetical protein QP022_09960 [Prevotella bivia]